MELQDSLAAESNLSVSVFLRCRSSEIRNWRLEMNCMTVAGDGKVRNDVSTIKQKKRRQRGGDISPNENTEKIILVSSFDHLGGDQ
jgi:hypothetical protein